MWTLVLLKFKLCQGFFQKNEVLVRWEETGFCPEKNGILRKKPDEARCIYIDLYSCEDEQSLYNGIHLYTKFFVQKIQLFVNVADILVCLYFVLSC